MTRGILCVLLTLSILQITTGNEIITQARCGSKADVIIVVPRPPNNGTVADFKEFSPLENFLIRMLNYLAIGKSAYNVGLLMYGRTPVVRNYLRPYRTRKLLNTEISLMANTERYRKELSGDVNVSLALETMADMFTNNLRRPDYNPIYNVKKIGVLILRNETVENETNAINIAAEVRKGGITLYVITEGTSGNDFALTVGTDQCKVYNVDNLGADLDRILPYLGNSLCGVTDKDLDPITAPDKQGICHSAIFYEPPVPEVNVVCDAIYINELQPDTGNCAYFWRCNGTVPERIRCSSGDVYDDVKHTCSHRNAATCYSQIMCPRPTGLFPYPGECHRYLNCYKGMPYVQTCPFVLVFDKNKRQCLHPTESDCPF